MHTPTTPRPWLPLIVGGLILAVIAVVAVGFARANDSISGSPVESPTFTLSGSLTLNQSTSMYASTVISYTASGCEGTGPYSDLSAGTAVVVADPQGQQVAVGTLTAGQMAGGACTMAFTVPDVPRGLSSYSVTISHRGTQVESPDVAATGVALTIGN